MLWKEEGISLHRISLLSLSMLTFHPVAQTDASLTDEISQSIDPVY